MVGGYYTTVPIVVRCYRTKKVDYRYNIFSYKKILLFINYSFGGVCPVIFFTQMKKSISQAIRFDYVFI